MDVQIDKDLLAASSTPLVLAILAEGERYGYAILERARELSDGGGQWDTVARGLNDAWARGDLLPVVPRRS